MRELCLGALAEVSAIRLELAAKIERLQATVSGD
jgi:hypothetical protein